MRPIRLYAGLFLLFALGVFAGGLGMGFFAKHQKATFFERRDGKHLESVLDHMTQQLGLSEAQRKQIRAILEDFQEEMITLRQKHFPELEALFEKNRVQIRKALTEAQRKLFDEFEKRMMERRPPLPGPDGPFGQGGPKPPGGPEGGFKPPPPGDWEGREDKPPAPPFPGDMQ